MVNFFYFFRSSLRPHAARRSVDRRSNRSKELKPLKAIEADVADTTGA